MSEILKTTEELKLINIDELIPYANNARTHSKDKINKLRSSLREFGFIAMDGKIDLIITKSVSRFARNTVDTLTIVRKLKENGVEEYFEKENIFTMLSIA